MSNMAHTADYRQAALEELTGVARREPVWQLALEMAEGDEAAARGHYVRMRAAQLVTDRKEHDTAVTKRREVGLFHDQWKLKVTMRTVLLGGVIVFILVIALWGMVHLFAGRDMWD